MVQLYVAWAGRRRNGGDVAAVVAMVLFAAVVAAQDDPTQAFLEHCITSGNRWRALRDIGTRIIII